MASRILVLIVLAGPAWSQDSVRECLRKYKSLLDSEEMADRLHRQMLVRRLGDIPGEPSAKALIDVLRRESWEPVVLEAMRAVGQVGNKRAFELMLKHAKPETRPGRLDAPTDALSSSKDDSVRLWIRDDLLGRKHSEYWLAAVESLERRPDPEALPRIREIHDSIRREAKMALRFQCVLALRSDPAIVEEAAKSKWWRLRVAAALALRDVSPEGQLLEKLRADARPEVRRAADPAPAPIAGRIFGLPVRGRSIYVLVDASPSMRARTQPPQPAQVVCGEVDRFLARLDANAKFQLAIYAGSVEEWRQEPTAPTDDARASATHWLSRRMTMLRGLTGTTNALTDVLRNPAYDAIVLVSDGLPNVASDSSPEDGLARIRDSNRYRRTPIYTVALTYGRHARIEREGDYPHGPLVAEFLGRLARQSGGATREIDSAPLGDR